MHGADVLDAGPARKLEADYRLAAGSTRACSTLAGQRCPPTSSEQAVPGLRCFAHGLFDYNDTWRYGFDVDRATSVNYIRDFSLGRFIGGTPDVLSSDVYGEGFGQGAYARLDSRFYQSLSTSIIDSQIPVVLPRFEYSYFGAVDSWGGRLSVDAGAFNILRGVGTNTRRGDLTATYERPWTGALGDLWTVTLHGTAAAYEYDRLNEEPNFSNQGRHRLARSRAAAGRDHGALAVRARQRRLGHAGDRTDRAGHRGPQHGQQPVQHDPQ